jgi:type II secretory pathway component PulC
MKQIFNASTINTFIWILGAMLLAKTIWFGVTLAFLPKEGISSNTKSGIDSLYYSLKLVKDEMNVVQTPTVTVQQDGLRNVKLLALYHASDMTIVTISNKGKTKVLARGEQINGYVLTGGGANYAEFTKNKKKSKIYLTKKAKGQGGNVESSKPSHKDTKRAKKIASKYTPKGLGEIKTKGNVKVVPKKMLEHYMNNAQDIYKNMGISEKNSASGLEGFNITFVRKGSHFEEIGLKRGDVIRGINGERLDSYEAAIAAYAKVKNGKNLTLSIERNNEEKEFEYEVD